METPPPTILAHLYREINGKWYQIGTKEAPIIIEDPIVDTRGGQDAAEELELVIWDQFNWDWELIEEKWWDEVCEGKIEEWPLSGDEDSGLMWIDSEEEEEEESV